MSVPVEYVTFHMVDAQPTGLEFLNSTGILSDPAYSPINIYGYIVGIMR